ncbi:Uma2 family endonuclease [Paenibacillus sp. YYML68]|uniref:Uma2 family endonuclease n=1 Tax=Paenibacillus sp. YYML68 TaxID=2909250 RepID=UPI002491C01F|nr:Uma2 family endonuclease [Paenibacillus sp. YYML68]
MRELRAPVTYAQYMNRKDEVRYEALNGEIISMSPSPTPRHQHIVGGLYTELRLYMKGKPCRPFIAPIDVCLYGTSSMSDSEIKDWVQPDLLVVCDPSKIEENRIVGAPDWIIEVLSPSTSKADRVQKYNAYARAGVKEYWIVDPYHEYIDTFVLEGQRYRQHGTYFRTDPIRSQLFTDLYIDLNELFDSE